MFPAKQNTTAFPLIPRSFTLGLSTGTLTPLTKSLASSSGKAVSLSGEIGFSDQLTLTLDGMLGILQFKGYVEDTALGLPHFQSPGDEYELKYFETHDPKLVQQLAVGMRYFFWSKNKLNPWFGASWKAQWHPAYELELEYNHLPTGMEISEEVNVPALQKPSSYAGFNLGFRYRFTENWRLQAGSFFDFN